MKPADTGKCIHVIAIIVVSMVVCHVAAMVGLGGGFADVAQVVWPFGEAFHPVALAGVVVGLAGGISAVMAAADIRQPVGRWVFIVCVEAVAVGAAYWITASFAAYVEAV